jgi:hypothetical protein
MHLPSAGMIRFRFDGFAHAHLSPSGHPEVSVNLASRAAIASGWRPATVTQISSPLATDRCYSFSDPNRAPAHSRISPETRSC